MRAPKYNAVKCSYKICPNPSVGYFTGSGYGLWLCKQHQSGHLQDPVAKIVKDPEKQWLLDMKVKNGKPAGYKFWRKP